VTPPQADKAAGEERIVVRDKPKTAGGTGSTEPGTPEPSTTPEEAADDAVAEGELVEGEIVDAEPVAATDQAAPPETPGDTTGEPVEGETEAVEPETGPLGAELAALRAELDERTKDLQRVSAEFANYRKRVDRDKGLVVEQATGVVLAALLPVLDDLDRARDHGDLVGPFSAVADQLTTALGKFGLSPFGEKGDAFDPTRHEAVAHLTSAEVTEPTCIDVMRRGYLLGDRLLRPALVAVADPE